MLIGRREELAAVRRRLTGAGRLVTLAGTVGSGKTALARAVADEHGRGGPAAVCWADVGEVAAADRLVPTVAQALGVGRPGDQDAGVLAEAVGERELLLVLDGCDAVLEEAALLVDELLKRCPRVRVLATSRRPLLVSGERVLAVPPLREEDAVALFAARATTAMPAFRVTPENEAAVAGICAALDGSPLAISLAAARMSLLSPQAVLDRLTDRYRLLTKGAPEAPQHQRSLRASVEVTFESCTAEEQTLWARASVFVGGFDLEAAEAVCSGDGLPDWQVLDVVDTLLERAVLVRQDLDESLVRYWMPETLRAYGAERLAPEADRWRDRHLDWCAALAGHAAGEWPGAGQPRLLRRLRSEVPNLRAALDHAVADPARSPVALRILVALGPFWTVAGLLPETLAWLDRALDHPTGDRVDRALAGVLGCWAELLRDSSGDVARVADRPARELLDAAERRLREAGRMLEAGRPAADGCADAAATAVLRAQAVLAAHRGHPADELLSQTVRRSTAAGDRWGEAVGHLLLGVVAELEGRHADAAAAHERCVRLGERTGEALLRSTSLLCLARSARAAGDTDRAEARASAALGLRAALDDPAGVAAALHLLAEAALGRGDGRRGSVLLGAARARRQVDPLPGADPALVRRGEALTAEEALQLVRHGVLPAGEPVQPVEEDSPLTAREHEVAELVGAGLSNREVAGELRISPRTAQGHVENILRKLGFSSRTQVAAWVAERRARGPTDRPAVPSAPALGAGEP